MGITKLQNVDIYIYIHDNKLNTNIQRKITCLKGFGQFSDNELDICIIFSQRSVLTVSQYVYLYVVTEHHTLNLHNTCIQSKQQGKPDHAKNVNVNKPYNIYRTQVEKEMFNIQDTSCHLGRQYIQLLLQLSLPESTYHTLHYYLYTSMLLTSGIKNCLFKTIMLNTNQTGHKFPE